MIADWLRTIRNDVATLQASWNTVHGGWAAARWDAAQLIAHRAIRVDSTAIVHGQQVIVLRTSVNLDGVTNTHIFRDWINASTREQIERQTQSHFASVNAAMGGFAAAVAMERLVVHFLFMLGGTASLIGAIRDVLSADWHEWLRLLATQWWLWSGAVAAGLGFAARLLFRWWLRHRFRRALTP